MTKQEKLKNLLKVFTPDETAPDFSVFDNEFQKLKDSLKEKVTVKTLEDVNVVLEKNRRATSSQLEKLNFEPLLNSFDKLKEDLTQNSNELITTLNQKQTELQQKILESNAFAEKGDEGLKQEIEALNMEIGILSARKVEIPDFGKQIKDTESKLMVMINTAKTLDSLQDEKEKESLQAQFANFEKQIKELKLALQNRGGGSMNRQIRVEGVDVLTKYTDINIYGVTSSVITSTDNINKRVNIGIQGGGGSGGSTIGLYVNSVLAGSQGVLNLTQGTNITISDNGSGTVTIAASAGSVVAGITRVASIITASQTGGSTALTDYVYIANAGLQLTLPTAIGNSNLYTIKNLAASSVLIGVTAGQTIDGSSSALLPVQYQSLDLISNGSVWSVI